MPRLRRIAFILFLVLFPVYLRTFYESRSALTEATRFIQTGNLDQAFSRLRVSLSWWSPGNLYALRAKENLQELFADETLGREERILAGRALYEGLMTGRNFLHDNFDERQQIKDQLYALNPELKPQFFRANKTRVSYLFQFLAQFCFWGWLLSVGFLIFSGFRADGTSDRKRLLASLGSALLLYFLWLLALSAA